MSCIRSTFLEIDVMMMLQRAVEPQGRLDDFVIVNLVVELGIGYSLDCCFSNAGLAVMAVIMIEA